VGLEERQSASAWGRTTPIVTRALSGGFYKDNSRGKKRGGGRGGGGGATLFAPQQEEQKQIYSSKKLKEGEACMLYGRGNVVKT